MSRSHLLFLGSLTGVIASALAVLAVSHTPALIIGAGVFTVATILCWCHASGATDAPSTESEWLTQSTEADTTPPEPPDQPPQLTRYEARQILDVEPDASDAELERAYRERVKTAHPDSGGTTHELRTVQQAYNRLRPEGRR